MYRDNKVAVSVPAYNEEALIACTLSGIPDYIDRIYVCNDGSKDSTKEKIEECMKEDSRVVLINHETNTGVGGAIIDCHKKALQDGMELIAVMAGDNQMDPAYLPNLLDPLVDGKADYTKGNRLYERATERGMSKWRLTGNRILTTLTKVATGNWNVSDPQNGYTAITADALRKLPLNSLYKGYLFENDMLVKLNSNYLRILDVPIPAKYGNEKSTIHYSTFISRGLVFMAKSFLWRLNAKYIIRNVYSWKTYLAFSATVLLGSFMTMVMGINNMFDHRPFLEDLIAPLGLTLLGMISLVSATIYRRTHQREDLNAYEI